LHGVDDIRFDFSTRDVCVGGLLLVRAGRGGGAKDGLIDGLLGAGLR
jgi:hypothetical protein